MLAVTASLLGKRGGRGAGADGGVRQQQTEATGGIFVALQASNEQTTHYLTKMSQNVDFLVGNNRGKGAQSARFLRPVSVPLSTAAMFARPRLSPFFRGRRHTC